MQWYIITLRYKVSYSKLLLKIYYDGKGILQLEAAIKET